MSETGNKNNIHRLVGEQYDRYPYPPVQESLADFIGRRSFQAGCPSRYFHLYWPFREKRLDLDILVAGCGTMQAAKFAVNLPQARITAIDISDGSIAHTNRLLEQHRLGNVETRRLPVEEVAGLGRQFDLIVSTGVLHHLPDPSEGLNALKSVLRDDGSMYLMLYGRYGRDGIYLMQDLFRRAGLSAASATPAAFDAVRDLLGRLPAWHPLRAKRQFFGDFNVDTEELVDLFLHPQDRGFSVPEIGSFLDCSGMKLQSMQFRAHYVPRCSGLASSALVERIERLPDIEQLAIGELFRAALHMHFFIACKAERPDADCRADLQGGQWRSLIPVRSPALRQSALGGRNGYVTELSSPLHQFEDIRCQLREAEAALFAAPDDRLDIAAIQEAVAARYPRVADDGVVRAFFSRMYDYDYLSFRGRPSSG